VQSEYLSDINSPAHFTINNKLQSVPVPGEDTYMKRLGMLVIMLRGIADKPLAPTFSFAIPLPDSFGKA